MKTPKIGIILIETDTPELVIASIGNDRYIGVLGSIIQGNQLWTYAEVSAQEEKSILMGQTELRDFFKSYVVLVYEINKDGHSHFLFEEDGANIPDEDLPKKGFKLPEWAQTTSKDTKEFI